MTPDETHRDETTPQQAKDEAYEIGMKVGAAAEAMFAVAAAHDIERLNTINACITWLEEDECMDADVMRTFDDDFVNEQVDEAYKDGIKDASGTYKFECERARRRRGRAAA